MGETRPQKSEHTDNKHKIDTSFRRYLEEETIVPHPIESNAVLFDISTHRINKLPNIQLDTSLQANEHILEEACKVPMSILQDLGNVESGISHLKSKDGLEHIHLTSIKDRKTILPEIPRTMLQTMVSPPPQYTIQEEIQNTGTFVQYIVYDTELARYCLAICSCVADYNPRLQIEAKLMALLDYPNIASLYSAGFQGNLYYTISEYIRGISLREWMKQGSHTLQQAGKIILDMAKILVELQKKAILHRYLNPDEITIQDDTPYLHWLSRGQFQGEETVLEQTWILQSGLAYMPPEIASGHLKEADFSTDVYSLGIILYEMLTGNPPIPNDNTPQNLRKIVSSKTAPGIRDTCPLIPEDIEKVCLKAIAKKKKDRYENAQVFLEDLSKIFSPPKKTSQTNLHAHNKLQGKIFPTITLLASILLVIACIYFISQTYSMSFSLQNTQSSLDSIQKKLDISKQELNQNKKQLEISLATNQLQEKRLQELLSSTTGIPILAHNAQEISTNTHTKKILGKILSKKVLTETILTLTIHSIQQIVALSTPKEVQIWNITMDTLWAVFPMENVVHIQIHPEKKYIVCISNHGNIAVYDYSKSLIYKTTTIKPSTNCTGMTISPNGSHVAIFRQTGIQLLNLENMSIEGELKCPSSTDDGKHVATFSPSDRQIIIACSHKNGTLQIWDSQKKRQPQTLVGYPMGIGHVECCSVDTDNFDLVLGCLDGTIQIWKYTSHKALEFCQTYFVPKHSYIAWDGMGKLFVSDATQKIYLWDISTNTTVTCDCPLDQANVRLHGKYRVFWQGTGSIQVWQCAD